MENLNKGEKNISQHFNIVAKLIDQTVEKGFGDKTLVYSKDKELTYKEMQGMINRVGNALHLLGVHEEEKVMLVMQDSPEAMASFYGSLKIGAVPVLVKYTHAEGDFCHVLNDSRALTVIASEDFTDEIDECREQMHHPENVIILGTKTKCYHISFQDIINGCSDQLQIANTSGKEAEIWNYASGITGIPRATVHLQQDVFSNLENYARGILNISQNDILFSASKFFFAYGLGNSFIYPPSVGASVVLIPDKPSPSTILSTIDRYKPTIFFGVPKFYADMLDIKDAEKKFDTSSLRLCVSTIETLPENIFYEWKERFGLEILHGIGADELIHIFISNRPGDIKPGSAGKIVPGYAAKIADDDGNEIPDGEVGNLHVKRESMNPLCNGQSDKNTPSVLGEWFNTGDWYYRDAEGCFYRYGASDNMQNVGSIWMSPIEIESALVSHPAVLEVAVVAKEDEKGQSKSKAFIVLKSGYEPSEQLAKQIQNYARKRIASYKYPQWIEFTKELPKTETGKIQRNKLRNGLGEKKKMHAKQGV
jgi:benzoate-CoA ligase